MNWQEHRDANGDTFWTLDYLGHFAAVTRFGQAWEGRLLAAERPGAVAPRLPRQPRDGNGLRGAGDRVGSPGAGMNVDAGARRGRCTVRQCQCRTYAWSDGQRSCSCGHQRRSHSQVWRPLVTTGGWDVGAA